MEFSRNKQQKNDHGMAFYTVMLFLVIPAPKSETWGNSATYLHLCLDQDLDFVAEPMKLPPCTFFQEPRQPLKHSASLNTSL